MFASTDQASGSWRLETCRPPGLCVVGGTVQVGIAEVGAGEIGVIQVYGTYLGIS
jgi:hypothetical protein